ncbi:hypothetical protein B0H16DRAFT_1468726 [Mycena metata]|uniref:Uncharacterized protein n=1 Tax=Mycena metata TaxID=1033252 RepID=A0AAD7I0Z9_9AGAR|nr:hypothetical protein B0H16DRAFT_1468726 [Mycena metata]
MAVGWYYSEHIHDMAKAIEHYEIALFLAQTNTDYKGLCITLGRFSWIKWLGGNYTASQAYAREAQKVAKVSGELFHEAAGLYYEALCLEAMSYYKQCISSLTRGITLIEMDVHRSRAECMIRLGDICKKSGDLLKALELWETARPLFERSSQVKRVQDIDERLARINGEVKEQHRINLRQLAELNVPLKKVHGVEHDSSEDKSDRGNVIGPVLVA